MSVTTGSFPQGENMFERALQLTTIATQAEAAQLVLHSAHAPHERTVSVLSSGVIADGPAILEAGEIDTDHQPATQTWCRSAATRAVCGPSGEEGWIAIGHRHAGQFNEATDEALQVAANLLEAILDKDLEHSILSELSAQLLASSLSGK